MSASYASIAYYLQIVAQRSSHPAHASVLFSLESVFAVFGGWMFLGEFMTPRQLLGCALMFAGMLAAQLWKIFCKKDFSFLKKCV